MLSILQLAYHAATESLKSVSGKTVEVQQHSSMLTSSSVMETEPVPAQSVPARRQPANTNLVSAKHVSVASRKRISYFKAKYLNMRLGSTSYVRATKPTLRRCSEDSGTARLQRNHRDPGTRHHTSRESGNIPKDLTIPATKAASEATKTCMTYNSRTPPYAPAQHRRRQFPMHLPNFPLYHR